MPKRSRKPSDTNQLAKAIVDQATGQAPPDVPEPDNDARKAAARLLGSIGGKKGGKARAAKLTPKRRAQIAKKAAKARWDKAEHAAESDE
jgi:hypothetical protein